MKIIQRRTTVEGIDYNRSYKLLGVPGFNGGWWFPCDEHGNIDEAQLEEPGKRNLAKCREGQDEHGNKIKDEGVITRKWQHREPAVGLCNRCDNEVVLYGFTNTCDRCGTDYNMSGQQLAHRSQWGEETGESLDDILGVDGADTDSLLEDA